MSITSHHVVKQEQRDKIFTLEPPAKGAGSALLQENVTGIYVQSTKHSPVCLFVCLFEHLRTTLDGASFYEGTPLCMQLPVCLTMKIELHINFL